MGFIDRLRKPSGGKRRVEGRRPLRTLAIYVIFGAICVVFVFFGIIPNQMGFQQGGHAALVNGRPVTVADWLRVQEAMENQYRGQMEGGSEAQRKMQTEQIRLRALEQLIDSEVLSQVAQKMGLVVADEEVRAVLLQIPAFLEDGRFKRDQYSQYLAQVGMSAGQFEAKLRRDLTVDRVRKVFMSAVQPVKGEKEAYEKLNNVKIEFDYLRLDPAGIKERVVVADADVQAYLKSPEGLAKVKAEYEGKKADFFLPEEVRARHILLKFSDSTPVEGAKKDAKANAVAPEKVHKEIAALREEIAKGAAFAQVAKSRSQDVASAKQGGDLGFFTRGKMVPEFEKVAFSLEPGVLSEPVRTSFGYHLIEVLAKKPARQEEFEAVAMKVAKSVLQEERAQALSQSFKEKLATADKVAFDSELKRLKMAAETSGSVALTATYVPKLGQAENLMSKLLAEPKMNEWLNHPVASGGQEYALKLRSVKTEQAKDDFMKGYQGKFLSMRSASETFSQWLDSEKAKMKIVRGQDVMKTN